MALADTYTNNHGQLKDFFNKIQEGQAPDLFTQQLLKNIGFASSNHRAYIPILKAIGFLTPEGVPTPRYHEYRSKANARQVMTEALREAYSDLFVIKEKPTESDYNLIEGKFKSTHNVSDNVAKLMSKTFFALLELADLNHTNKKVKEEEPKREEESKQKEDSSKPVLPTGIKSPTPSLHYNIQIHLPPTKDIEVFNAIFKSLKEHLLE